MVIGTDLDIYYLQQFLFFAKFQLLETVLKLWKTFARLEKDSKRF